MTEAFVLTSVIAEAEDHATQSPLLGITDSNDRINTSTHHKIPILAYLELSLKYVYNILHGMLSFP